MNSRIVYPAPSFQPPETCTEHEECRAGQASNADLCRAAQAHYDRISTAAHEWHSAIPKAIAAYFDGQSEASDAATSMRSACVEKLRERANRYQVLANDSLPNDQTAARTAAAAAALNSAADELESLSIEKQSRSL